VNGSAYDTRVNGERRNAHGQAKEFHVDGPDHHRHVVHAAGDLSRNGPAAAADSDGGAIRIDQLTGEHPVGVEPVGYYVEPLQTQRTGHRPEASARGLEGSMDLGLAGWLLVPLAVCGWDDEHRPSSGSVVVLLLKETPSGGGDDAARA
jgi:hypothetical protein